MGNTDLSVPSTKAHATPICVKPRGANCMAGAKNTAMVAVMSKQIKALRWPAILKPSIKTNSRTMGRIETSAAIRSCFVGDSGCCRLVLRFCLLSVVCKACGKCNKKY